MVKAGNGSASPIIGRPKGAFLTYQTGEHETANAVSALIFAQAFYWVCRGLALIIKALKQ